MRIKHENNFDSIAWIYDWLSFAIFGDTLLQAQQALLDYIPENSRILFIGGGTGKILPQLCMSNPAKICYVEKSTRMLAKAQQQGPFPEMIVMEWIVGDENHPSVQSQTFDVILTFFMLDLFQEPTLQTLISILSPRLAPKGTWLVADFNPAAHDWFTWVLYWGMYRFFRLTSQLQAQTLPDYPRLLCESGFQVSSVQQFYAGRILSQVYERL